MAKSIQEKILFLQGKKALAGEAISATPSHATNRAKRVSSLDRPMSADSFDPEEMGMLNRDPNDTFSSQQLVSNMLVSPK